MVNRKLLETTLTPPTKYAFNPEGRVRHVARVIGVKLPPAKGRKPKNHGDEDAFFRSVCAHHDRNMLRNAVAAVLDLASCYTDKLSNTERRTLADIATQAFAGKAVRQ